MKNSLSANNVYVEDTNRRSLSHPKLAFVLVEKTRSDLLYKSKNSLDDMGVYRFIRVCIHNYLNVIHKDDMDGRSPRSTTRAKDF